MKNNQGKNKNGLKIGMGLLAVLFIILANYSFFIVYEDEVAVVETFGKLTKAIVNIEDLEKVNANLSKGKYEDMEVSTLKGLHFRIPFVQNVRKYSSKYVTYLSAEELINTLDNRRIQIQTYAQYKVADPVGFTIAVGGNFGLAHNRMDEYVYKTVINTANQLSFNEFFYKETVENLLNEKLVQLNEKLVADFGIYISDIGVNRKTFPANNVATIEQKMSKEIEKESEKLTAEGDSEYNQAQAKADREYTEIVAKAKEEAALIRAEADAQALKIYDETLSKDLEFYRFIKRMEYYRELKGNTYFVNEKNDFLKYLDGYKGK